MQLFFSKAERIELVGFDDRLMVILGIGVMSVVSYMLFSPAIIAANGPIATGICTKASIIHTVTYWIVIRWIVLHLRRRYFRPEETARRLFFTGISIVAIVTLLKGTDFFHWIGATMEQEGLLIKKSPWYYDVITTLMLCFLVVAVYETIYFFTKYRRGTIERERLARSNMQSQLSALRQQINPHFLFNSLNTLSSIIPEDPQKATQFTQRLSSVYRRLTENRHETFIPLAEELAALRDYIFLLQTRFEDKLKVEIAIPQAYLSSQIPPLSLQLLLENVVKHNVLTQQNPIHVTIKIQERFIVISNDLKPKLRKEGSTGLGLQNIQQRYELLSQERVRIEAGPQYFRVYLPIIWAQPQEENAIA